MRRSVTTFQAVEAKQPLSRRSATALVAPSINIVEKCLDQLALNSMKVGSDEEMTSTAYGCDLVDAAIKEEENHEGSEGRSEDESDQVYHGSDQEHDEFAEELEANEKEKREKESDDEQESEGKKEKGPENATTGTLRSDTVSSCHVHKSLKDLIFKTNKEIYAVDSNKVKYKVGLSKRGSSLPSLHPKKRLTGNDFEPQNIS